MKYEGSHNGYLNKLDKIVKRNSYSKKENKLIGEDSLISYKK